ncbi:hypothetical protein DD590_14055 [Klebsiella pneumoniae]|nr:hypothetical protein DD590_14055 [Klebsiella pneumoniae]
MRKSRTPGSVRGVSGNGYPYRDIIRFLSCKILFIIQSDVSDVAEKRRKMRPLHQYHWRHLSSSCSLWFR